MPLKEQNNHNIPDEKAADMAWTDYTSSNKSIIVQLFAGQQRSSLRCAACGAESVTFEPFFNLSLPIPQSRSQCNIMVGQSSLLLTFKLVLLNTVSLLYRTALSCTPNLNRLAVGLVHSVSIRKGPAKPLTFGNCRPSLLSTSRGKDEKKKKTKNRCHCCQAHF